MMPSSAVDRVLASIPGAKAVGSGWQARCPAHDDRHASLSIAQGDDGRALLKCHAGCSVDAVVSAAGLTLAALHEPRHGHERSSIVATYDYPDEHGVLLYQAARMEPKDFRQRRPDGAGGYIWKLGDVRRVLYRLPELHAKRPEAVFITEGEKDAHGLERLGLVATTNAGGACKWREEYTQQLVACGVRRVYVLPDNDDPGRAHATQVARSCYAAGVEARIVTLPDLPVKGDVSDWLRAGNMNLIELAEAAPVWSPMAEVSATATEEAVTEPAIDASDVFEHRVRQALYSERVRREARARLDAEQHGPLDPPVIETLRERLLRLREVVRYRIDGWQPIGARVMVAAQFKAGKTTLTGNAARSLVDGDLFLGQYRVEPVAGRVTLLDFEMSSAQLDEWLAAQGIRNTDRVAVMPMRGRASTFNILDAKVRALWAGWLREAATSYLIVDCVRPILDALGLDEHKDAGRFLVSLDALLAEAGIGEAMVVHHMGHTGERARGDSRLRDWPDVEWRLIRRDDDPSSPRFITAYGRDVNVSESELAYDASSRHLSIVGGSRKDAVMQEALSEVIAILRDSPDALSGRAIEAACIEAGTSYPRKQIRAAVESGIATGAITFEVGLKRARLHRLGQCASAPQCAASAPTHTQISAPVRRAPLGAAHSAHTSRVDERQGRAPREGGYDRIPA